MTEFSSPMATVGEHGKRKWVYADLPKGRFARARNVIYALLIVFYIVAPFLSIAGQPLLRFDLPARHFSIFGVTFVTTDLFLLALLLVTLVIALFFFSALLGRLWCGWACPQTVYLEGMFRRMERWIEGTPLERRKLDGGPRADAYWAKKIVKHGGFALFSVLLSLAFTAYFIGPRTSFGMVANFGAGHGAAFITALVIAALTYFNFAYFREQFCTFLCPYARFQSVMLDDHSLIVGYDPVRGEPRGAKRPADPWEGRGDCIDCKRCVQVCPTGIDIRDGLQLECVSCTACIDACDAVMERVGRPRGLIRYDSLAGLARKPRKILRGRVVVYSVILLALLSVFTTRLLSRDIVSLAVARAPGIPYLMQDDGRVRNLFSLRITNTDAQPHTMRIELDGAPDMELLVPGQPFTVNAGQRVAAEAFVMRRADHMTTAETKMIFRIVEDGVTRSQADAVFLGPVSHP
jgi:cytochrome c oxidase accessory protein FixG